MRVVFVAGARQKAHIHVQAYMVCVSWSRMIKAPGREGQCAGSDLTVQTTREFVPALYQQNADKESHFLQSRFISLRTLAPGFTVSQLRR